MGGRSAERGSHPAVSDQYRMGWTWLEVAPLRVWPRSLPGPDMIDEDTSAGSKSAESRVRRPCSGAGPGPSESQHYGLGSKNDTWSGGLSCSADRNHTLPAAGCPAVVALAWIYSVPWRGSALAAQRPSGRIFNRQSDSAEYKPRAANSGLGACS
jgi:hypothetical protein